MRCDVDISRICACVASCSARPLFQMTRRMPDRSPGRSSSDPRIDWFGAVTSSSVLTDRVYFQSQSEIFLHLGTVAGRVYFDDNVYPVPELQTRNLNVFKAEYGQRPT